MQVHKKKGKKTIKIECSVCQHYCHLRKGYLNVYVLCFNV